MNITDLLKKTAKEQRDALLNKDVSAVELVNATYENIEKYDDTIGAYNSLCKEKALETAKAVDEKIAKKELTKGDGCGIMYEPSRERALEGAG